MYIIRYNFKGRWFSLNHEKRFWEKQRFDTHDDAAAAIDEIKKVAPASMRFRILKGRP